MTPDQPPAAAPRRPRVRRRPRTAQEARVWRRKVTGYALFIGAFVLMVNALVGGNGYLATIRNETEYQRLARQLAGVRTDNQRLQDDLARLRNDRSALEEAARRNGLKRPGEITIILKDPQPPRTAPEPRPVK
jgi:cell division protein FtsB